MNDTDRLAMAKKELKWIQAYCAPEMQGFESDHDRLIFNRISRCLAILETPENVTVG